MEAFLRFLQVNLPTNGTDYLNHQYGWVILVLFLVMGTLVMLVGAILHWQFKRDMQMARAIERLADSLEGLNSSIRELEAASIKQGALLDTVITYLGLQPGRGQYYRLPPDG